MYLSVGDLVYRAYVPNSPGKVVKVFNTVVVVDRHKVYGAVRVKWLDGTETIEAGHHLNKLTTLIEDHRRRLKKHEAKLPALKAL